MPDPTGATISALPAGLYYGIDAASYHADPCAAPSLSSGAARLLLERSPLHAWTAHPRLNPAFEREEKSAMDFGSAAHELVLGKGRGLAVIDAKDWRTKEAKEARDAARAEGLTPILAADHDRAQEIAREFAAQIAGIPLASEAFGPDGRSEAVMVWREDGAWCRGMVDRLLIRADGSVLAVDYKTTSASAHPASVSRRLFDMGQDFQAAFYRRGIEALAPRRHYEALILTQEIEPPFALSAMTLDPAAWAKAGEQVETAIALWRRCLASGRWPGYPPLVGTAELPTYVESAWVNRRDAIRHAAATDLPAGLTILSAG